MATREKKKETTRKGGKTRFFRMWALQIDNAERQRKAPTDRRRHDTKERRKQKKWVEFSLKSFQWRRIHPIGERLILPSQKKGRGKFKKK